MQSSIILESNSAISAVNAETRCADIMSNDNLTTLYHTSYWNSLILCEQFVKKEMPERHLSSTHVFIPDSSGHPQASLPDAAQNKGYFPPPNNIW